MEEKRKIKRIPKSTIGKWSLILSAVLIILFILGNYLYLPILCLKLAFPIDIACLILGLIAILKKDKAILLILPIVIGLRGLYWTVIEILDPHLFQ